jgi:flavin-dependent trigonelline monooxygenase, oxygenase component
MSLKFWANYPFFYPDLNRPYSELVHEVIDISQAAEDLGFEGISFPEHHFYNYICNPSALQMCTLVAAKTKRLKLQAGVLVLPFYHPMALAEEVALVDHISEGRLSIGVGRGGVRYEPERLGIDYTRSRDIYEDSLDLLKRAWTEDDIAYDGRFWSFPAATAIPKPYQKPYPPIWVAAQSEVSIKGVGAKGLNMMTSPNLGCFAPHGDMEKALGWYNDASEQSPTGRGEVMLLRRVFIDETEEKALRQLENIRRHWGYYMAGFTASVNSEADRFRDREEISDYVQGGKVIPRDIPIKSDDVYNDYDDPIITSPDKAITRFKYYESVGVNHISALTAFGGTVDEVIHSMEMMSKHVFPAFAEDAAATDDLVSTEA